MDSLPHPVAETDDDRRATQRISVDSLAVLSSSDRARTTRLVNISAGGALVGPLFGVDVGDRAVLTVPGYGGVSGWVARMSDDNYAAVVFSPDPDFHQLCEERGDELQELIRDSQMAFHNPQTGRVQHAL